MPDNQHTCNDNQPYGAPYDEVFGKVIKTYQDYECSICHTHMSRQEIGSRPNPNA